MSNSGSVSVDDERVIELSRIKLVMLIGGSLLMTAAGFGFYFASVGGSLVTTLGRFGPVWIVHALGALSVLFFGACAVYAITKVFDRQPGLVLGPAGLVDNSSAVAAGFIPWSDVTGVEIFRFGRQKMLVIRVADPEKYIARGNPLKRALNRANTGMVGSPVAISSNTLRIPFHELREEVASRFARHAEAHRTPPANTPPPARRGSGS
jgi:hypothetical protein